ncbi:hypothetical protein [Spirosoma areae]
MPDTPTTALIKTAQSPALARVSNQLALTDKQTDYQTRRAVSDSLSEGE